MQLNRCTNRITVCYKINVQQQNILSSKVRKTRYGRQHRIVRFSAAPDELQYQDGPNEIDVEAEAERFMRQQAEIESGATTIFEPQQVVGADVVDDETAKEYCREIVENIKLLKEKRDMSFSELKLIVAIEDPRVKENRKLGVERDSGVSRDEMAAALQEVAEGRVPKDRVALKEVHSELINWPYLQEVQYQASQEESLGWREGQARPPMGRDKNEKPQSLLDRLPDWVGYGAIYGVSVVPIIIGVLVVTLLFFSSLR
eukprot:TRINITY_DN6203_c0_g1_i1.p2 TRINITY_DN6203_c0_g1~~TRINITY_DN6203_c0_g1_i1.p2  ORF type:complete len:258 (-),score=33.43 TRINITY_DN6203_c0_g1_i1:214-987(-)